MKNTEEKYQQMKKGWKEKIKEQKMQKEKFMN